MADRETTITLSVKDNFSAQLRQFANQIDAAEKSTDGMAKKGSKGFGDLKQGVGNAVQELTGFSLTTLTTAGAIGALGAGLKYSIDQAMQAEQAMAQTEATIKATGGAAGLTADQVVSMATSLSSVTGIADDVIQSGQNMLLTFKNIKGEAQFDRATKALTDMAVAMNGGSLAGIDLKGSAIQLGKALNDPVAGISALTRVGVTFTAEQKEMIKAMVAAGDTAGAQTIILKELESEFGGAAEAAGNTTAGAFAKLKNSTDNLAESLGTMFLPMLADAAQGLNDLIYKGQEASISTGEFTGMISAQEAAARRAALANGDLAAGNLYAGKYAEQAATQTEDLRESNRLLSIQAGGTADAAKAAAGAVDAWSAAMMDADMGAAALIITTDQVNKKIDEAAAKSFVAAGVQGTLRNATDQYTGTVAKNRDEIINLQREIEKLQSANGKQYTATEAGKYSANEYALQVQKAAEAHQRLSENTDPDKQLALTVAAEKADGAVAKMGASMGTTTTGVIDNSTKIGELNEKLQALTDENAKAEAAMQLATKEMLYQKLSAGEDAETQLELARKLGLLSEADYNAAKSAAELKQRHDDGKLSTEGFANAAQYLADKLNGLTDKTVTVTVKTVGGDFGQVLTGGVSNQLETRRAAGGPVTAGGTYRWNEPGSQGEVLVPAGDGYVLNKHDAAQALAAAPQGGGLSPADILMLSSSIARAVRDGIMAAG